MGFLDRLLGRHQQDAGRTLPETGAGASVPASGPPAGTGDEAAIERYRYLLRTAPPERIEQAHAEAFEQLTPDQRREVLRNLSQAVPESERATSDDPRALARMATRAEMRKPGTLESSLGRGSAGMGGLLAGSLLASVAGAFIGTAVAGAMFSDFGDDAAADDGGGDFGGDELGGGDFGGDIGF